MTVQFHSLRDIREFVGLATLQSYPIHVADAAGATADAKCFMEMFTVEFTQPLTLLIGADADAGPFLRGAARFLIDPPPPRCECPQEGLKFRPHPAGRYKISSAPVGNGLGRSACRHPQ